MEIRYTRHARSRMAQRGITELEVERVMARPLLHLRRQVLKGRVGGRSLTALLSARPDAPRAVISAWD